MRLLLISDTHLPRRAKRLPQALLAELPRADVVFHAGDWVDTDTLDLLESRSRRLIGVYGNNDGLAAQAHLRGHPVVVYVQRAHLSHRLAQRRFGRGQERLRLAHLAHGMGGHRAHLPRRDLRPVRQAQAVVGVGAPIADRREDHPTIVRGGAGNDGRPGRSARAVRPAEDRGFEPLCRA